MQPKGFANSKAIEGDTSVGVEIQGLGRAQGDLALVSGAWGNPGEDKWALTVYGDHFSYPDVQT